MAILRWCACCFGLIRIEVRRLPTALHRSRSRSRPLTLSLSRSLAYTATLHVSRSHLTPLMVAAKHDRTDVMCCILRVALGREGTTPAVDDDEAAAAHGHDSGDDLTTAFRALQLERGLPAATTRPPPPPSPSPRSAASDAGAVDSDGISSEDEEGTLGGATALRPVALPLHPTVDALDRDGHTALYHAAANGAAAAAALLVSVGAAVERRTNKGRTPLLISARRGHLDVVAALLHANAHVDARSTNGVTPIFTAANKGHTEVVLALLAAGADANSSDNLGYTPLFIACQHGHTAAARVLLKGVPGRPGANLEISQRSGFTPLHVACHAGMIECVALLLGAGAGANARSVEGETPLALAVEEGHLDVVRALIASHASVDRADCRGFAPLHIAANAGRPRFVDALLRAGADPLLRVVRYSNRLNAAGRGGGGANGGGGVGAGADPFRARPATAAIVHAAHGGGGIQLEPASGRSALWFAAGYGQAEIVEMLVEAMGSERVGERRAVAAAVAAAAAATAAASDAAEAANATTDPPLVVDAAAAAASQQTPAPTPPLEGAAVTSAHSAAAAAACRCRCSEAHVAREPSLMLDAEEARAVWRAAALAPSGPHAATLRKLGSLGVGLTRLHCLDHEGGADDAREARKSAGSSSSSLEPTRVACAEQLRVQYEVYIAAALTEAGAVEEAEEVRFEGGGGRRRRWESPLSSVAAEAIAALEPWHGREALQLLTSCRGWTALHFAVDARDALLVRRHLRSRHTVLDATALTIASSCMYAEARLVDATLCETLRRAQWWSPASIALWPRAERRQVVVMHLLWSRLQLCLVQSLDVMMWWSVVAFAVSRE